MSGFKRRYHLFIPLLGQVRPLYTPGIPDDGGIAEWQELFAEEGRLSTHHISVVDRRAHAMQTGAVIIRVIEAAHSNQPLQ